MKATAPSSRPGVLFLTLESAFLGASCDPPAGYALCGVYGLRGLPSMQSFCAVVLCLSWVSLISAVMALSFCSRDERVSTQMSGSVDV